jgi:hypothetical protein
LKEVDYEDHKGEHLLFNDTATLKFTVINESQVVFFDPILESEEKADEKADKRISTTKDDA